ncbi:MAG TPA: type II secretion system major pseudopilin GspG [Caulobacteraceae bacterium]|jgi:general secretion pathway protein G|nr:type II secretion system major pseudopilin GspG [Caulobacteraceae bacterium]
MARFSLPRKKAGPAKSRLRGYTLTEMLVVIAIIGLIAAVVIPQTIGQLGKAQSRAAKLQVQSLAAALELFQGDNGRFPTAQEGLPALLARPAGLDNWSGPYLHGKDQLKDPWGHPYRYTLAGPSVTVASLGADDKAGGEGADRDVSASVP